MRVHSNPGDKLLDFFAGSGSFGDAADRNGRDCVLVDSSKTAISVMKKRFRGREVQLHGGAKLRTAKGEGREGARRKT